MKDTQIFGRDSTGTFRDVRTTSTGEVAQGFQARQTNPTAASDTAQAIAISDDVGRQVNWPYQVRDLAQTASVSLTTGTAATLVAAGGTGVFHDLMHISFANNSATASVQLLQDSTVMKTIQVPASNTLSLEFTYPIPQGTANTVWTADMEDITGTTVTIDALFIKNV